MMYITHMKTSATHLSKYRVRTGLMGSDDSYGISGMFKIPFPNGLTIFDVIATNGVREHPIWEHVSVKAHDKGSNRWRCPKWNEMCYIKDLFWEKNETVIQFHPEETEYVNNHPAVLHLWRPVEFEISLPPIIYV